MALIRVTYLPTVGVDADNTDPNVANAATIYGRAQTALTTNQTYLALSSPTTAQNTAQIKALTRQMDAMLRFLLNQFDSTADS